MNIDLYSEILYYLGDPIIYKLGLQWFIFPSLAFKSGYELNSVGMGNYSFGIKLSLKLKNINNLYFEYSLTPISIIGYSHNVGITTKF